MSGVIDGLIVFGVILALPALILFAAVSVDNDKPIIHSEEDDE